GRDAQRPLSGARALDLRFRAGERVPVARREHERQVSPRPARQRARGREPDPAAAAGDEDRLGGEHAEIREGGGRRRPAGGSRPAGGRASHWSARFSKLTTEIGSFWHCARSSIALTKSSTLRSPCGSWSHAASV